MATTSFSTIDGHPDLVELRARYEAAAETPQARAVDGMTFLAGSYVAISPWVVGFGGATPMVLNNVIIGLVLTVLALGYASAFSRTHNLAWVTPVLGAWIVISQWVIADVNATAGMIISNVITGGIVILLGIGLLMTGLTPTRSRSA